jgi:inner membrane protein
VQRKLLYRLLAIGGLSIVLVICLGAIAELVYERQERSLEVKQDIARNSAYQQKVSGPVLVIPYRRIIREVVPVDLVGTQTVERISTGSFHLLPDSLNIDGTLKNEVRSRGIYRAHLYRAQTLITGEFLVPPHFSVTNDLADYSFGQPVLSIGITDIRGIDSDLKLSFDDSEIAFQPGSASPILKDGVHAEVPVLDLGNEQRYRFRIPLNLQGTEQLRVMPVGKTTKVHLTSGWPHPSFIGEFLPVDRKISDAGFDANWSTSFFATNMQSLFDTCHESTDCEALSSREFGVSLVDPVDQYVQSERSLKYGLLFIGLTFAGFFLFEILKSIAVHPVQYGFVGMALVIFYLLLLSLSEHIGFAAAYATSTTACVLLIGGYLRSVLHSTWRAMGFSAGLAAVYGVLYTVLNAEDFALLLGSLLLFFVLGLAMYVSRRVDWFGIDKPSLAPAAG